MNINTINGKSIKNARNKRNYTQEQLADLLHVTKQAVSNWETGKNRPDEDIRFALEKELGVKLQYNYANRVEANMRSIKPLQEIKDLQDVLDCVDDLVNAVDIEEVYAVSVRKMLRMLLIEIIGYNCYYIDLYDSQGRDGRSDWGDIAYYLDALINVSNEDFLPNDTSFPFRFKNDLLLKRIEWIAYVIGGELFEDFDDSGYRDGFPQQIGRYAEACGYDLLKVMPGKDTSLRSVLLIATLSLSEIVEEHYQMHIKE